MADPNFANIPSDDLQHIANGNMDKVSEPTLRYLAGQPQGPIPTMKEPSGLAGPMGSALESAVTPLDTIASGVSHAASATLGSPLALGARVLAMLRGQNPDAAAAAAHNFINTKGTYHAQTPGGQTAENDVAGATGTAMAPLQRIANAIEAAAPKTAPGIESAAGTANDVIGSLPIAGAVKTLAGEGASAVTSAAQDAAGKLGFRTAEENPVGHAMAGTSTGPALIGHNAAVGNTVIGREAGLARGVEPNYQNLAAARTEPDGVYDRVAAAVPDGPLNAKAQAAVKAAGQPAGGRVTQGSPQAQNMIENLRAQLLAPTNQEGGAWTGQNWINELRGLRQEGYTNIGSDDVSNQQLGQAQLDMARAVEGHIGDSIPDNSNVSLQQFQNARKALAKNWTAQSTLRGDTFDLRALGRIQRADPTLLDGDMETAADFANKNSELVGVPNTLNSPSLLHDLSQVTLTKPASWVQPVTGALGRRLLTGGTPGVLARTSAMLPGRPNMAPLEPQPPAAPPWTTSPGAGGPAPAPAHPGTIPLADLLSTGVEHGAPSELTAGPMGAPSAGGLPFRVPPEHMAGDVQLAPENAWFTGKQPSLGDLAGVMSQGVPEGIMARAPVVPQGARMASAGRPGFLTNNASGESAASQEAINRGTRDLALVDSDGNETPILRDVTQADQRAPKGSLIVDRNNGEIIDRGGMNQRAATALRNRWASLQRLGDTFVSR